MKNKLTLAVAALGILALSACGSGSPSGGADSSADAGGDLEKITVGVIPIVDTAPIFLGDSKGFFEEEGLDLEIQTATGGSAIVPGIQSGSYDFAFSNYVSLMVANDKGLNMKVVANGVTTTGDADTDFGAVVVTDDSPIKTPKDLAGKKVSVNNLSNIGDITVSQVVKDDGGDPSTVDFVEVPFPDAPAALENGIVDAAWILDPFLVQSLGDGARVVSNNFVDFDPELDIAGYFTSAEKVSTEPEQTAKFQRAMNKSLEYAQEHPQEVRDIVGTYTKIDADTREELVLPRYRVDINTEAAQKLGDAAQEFGAITKPVDLETLLP
ncbi:ABC transporter substrate-binding protein [Paeniglutamicibacter gangotriensis]|uniref:Aliphatic sulfonates ABC transporter aliphatic sulfonates-binding protein SsuA n=2 Tax=Paeniglutamicibacter gangotriensis TaxID=254787 RepID=M7MZH9_9MICC|nr:ABC transporter substrate-binding protein [Paeniglutamicibacter gangotriensis]EMR00351.1 aliphatic sulfonates ABC transporter aliphatic sulfonates-binding protein SsuA [Paeniglutamicibacter gangotriensis Lz1y]KAA0979238.1 PhnD/SsuA/transferrin family substrate-binding protein [Paeniglutamicibacter gangotriensis]